MPRRGCGAATPVADTPVPREAGGEAPEGRAVPESSSRRSPVSAARGRRPRGLCAENDIEDDALASALDLKADRIAGLVLGDRGGEVVRGTDRLAVDGGHEVAGSQAGAVGRSVTRDPFDLDTGRTRTHHHTQKGVLDPLAPLQLGQDLTDRVRWHGEPNPGVESGRRNGDLRGDADDSTLIVEERAARVARQQARVGLDRPGDREPVRRADLAIKARHGPVAGRRLESQRVADGDYPITDIEQV